MGQNQSSAPWFRPPNTLCNTDGWRRTRKSTSKITVRSAKKQERLKKKTWNAKPKCYWVWPRDALAPSWPRMWTTGTRLFATSQGSPTSSPIPHLSHPPWWSAALRKPAGDPLSCQSQVRSAWGRIWRSREAESAVCGSQRDVNTDKTSWLLSWLQWKYLWFSPSAVFTLGLREI